MWIKIRRFALGAGATLGPQPGAKIAPPAPAWLLRRPPPRPGGRRSESIKRSVRRARHEFLQDPARGPWLGWASNLAGAPP